MTAEVRAVIEQMGETVEDDRISVPALAVIGDAEGNGFVWIVDENEMTVHKRAVEVGPMTGSENIVILDGLASGDVIVVAGLTKLQDGMKVRLWEEQ
jgi:multidrug efflux pump subunit AcrA (membrane-fusion protein)